MNEEGGLNTGKTRTGVPFFQLRVLIHILVHIYIYITGQCSAVAGQETRTPHFRNLHVSSLASHER